MSLNKILGTNPDGTMDTLSDDNLTKFLRTRYGGDNEAHRKDEIRKRLDLYKDRGRRHYELAIDRTHSHPDVKNRLKSFLDLAEFQNVTKRIAREISTVYSEQAHRTVAAPKNENYQRFQDEIRQDRRMRQVNRFGNLLRNVLVWPDVVEGRAIQRMVTPDKFSAISHPNDPLWCVGYIIDQVPDGVSARPTDRHYLVMAANEYLWLDKDWRLVSRAPHSLGELPALLLSADEPDERLLDAGPGRDISAAHISVVVLNAQLLQHQKSGTKMAIATGDTSGMARGQALHDEGLLEAPEGVGFQTLDMGADPNSYISVIRNLLKQIAANYGIPESVFDLSYQATSGFEIELKRTGLREIRRDQILDYRPFEKRLAELWSKVLTQSAHPLTFTTEKWSIQFGDTDAPDAPMSKLEYWEKLEQMGLANRIEMYMEMNPEASETDAITAIDKNVALRIDRMQQFQTSNGGLFGPSDSANQPSKDGPE